MPQKSGNIIQKPMDRRQFLRYGVAGSAAAWLAAQGFPLYAQAQGGTMVWLGHQEVAGMSPNDSGPTVQYSVITNIINPLLMVNHLTEIEPILAQSYELAEDGLSYTFKLHEGVLFHNGEELTAEDVKYTYEFYAQDGNTITSRFTGMRDVEVLDRYTVRVNMDTVNASFLSIATETGIVPAAYHAEVGEDIFRTAPIGTGAFKLKEWRAAEFTEIEAFEDHFRGRPSLDAIRLEVVPEPSVRYIALVTGDAQANVWPLLVEDSLSFEGDPDFRLVKTFSNSVRFIPLNNQLPQLSDVRVRRAMLMALDRQRIIDDLWSGTATIAHSHLTPKNAFYFNPNVRQYEFDPDGARALLDEAGWTPGSDGIRVKDGLRLSFTCTTITGDQARRPIAELSQIMLRDVGVEMMLAEAPVASILEGLRQGTMDASLFNWTHGSTPEPDPSATLSTGGGNNFCNYFNPEMDELISRGLQTVDPEERRAIYFRTQEIYAEDVPALILHYDEWMNVFSSRIQNMPEEIVSSDPVFARGFELGLG